MRREFRERFPRQPGVSDPDMRHGTHAVRAARAVIHAGIAN